MSLRVPYVGCEHCLSADNEMLLPSYGPAPHKSFNPAGEIVTEVYPREQWPVEFVEDADEPGCGTYYCEHCWSGAPVEYLITAIKKLRENLANRSNAESPTQGHVDSQERRPDEKPVTALSQPTREGSATLAK